MRKLIFIGVLAFTQQVTAQFKNKIDTIGNIGVGILSPDSRLHVMGTHGDALFSPKEDLLHVGGNELGGVGGFAGIVIGGTTDGRYANYIRAVKTLGYSNFWNTALTFSVTRSYSYTNTDEVMRLTSSGNVGIGTINPGTTLHVVGANNNASVSGDATYYGGGRKSFNAVYGDPYGNGAAYDPANSNTYGGKAGRDFQGSECG